MKKTEFTKLLSDLPENYILEAQAHRTGGRADDRRLFLGAGKTDPGADDPTGSSDAGKRDPLADGDRQQ